MERGFGRSAVQKQMHLHELLAYVNEDFFNRAKRVKEEKS